MMLTKLFASWWIRDVVLLGPINALHHPFLERDMSVVVGPGEAVGHPWRVVTEVPMRREVGEHIVYAFATHWLYSNLELLPEDEIEAIVLWDPGWMRNGVNGEARNEIHRVWELSQKWDVPIIGVYSDWFAAWKVDAGVVGTLGSMRYIDAAIIDPVGAAAFRSTPLFKVHDPTDHRFRPLVEMPRYLTYGRLPTVGAPGADIEIKPTAERSVDVSMVSTLHPQHVVFRPYYVEMARAVCEANGWGFELRERETVANMEALYLDSKVVLNVALGTQPNCRVYEALACGANLVTDSYTHGMNGIPCVEFSDERSMEKAIRASLEAPPVVQAMGLQWAYANSPTATWQRILNKAVTIAPQTREARAARKSFEEEMRKAGVG